jgi:hypothetical protein
LSFSNHTVNPASATLTGKDGWYAAEIESAYVPVKEMLANAPGFVALYERRDMHFEEVYRDIVLRAQLPITKGPKDPERKRLLAILKREIEGSVVLRANEFFLKNRQGSLEFTLLAEGVRKLGLLWLLIQNETLLRGSVLFWDEPEANLHPPIIRKVVEILLHLQQLGVQVFIATHDYVVLKELDLQTSASTVMRFHSLFRDRSSGDIFAASADEYLGIDPNTIRDTFAGLYERDVDRSLGLRVAEKNGKA